MTGWRGILAVLVFNLWSHGNLLVAESADQIAQKLIKRIGEQSHAMHMHLAEHRRGLAQAADPVLTALINDRRFDQAIAFEDWIGHQRTRPQHYQAEVPGPSDGPGAIFIQEWFSERARLEVAALEAQITTLDAGLQQLAALQPDESRLHEKLQQQARELRWKLRASRDQVAGLDPQRIPSALAGLPHAGRPGNDPLDTQRVNSLARSFAEYWNAYTLALAECLDAERASEPAPQELLTAVRAAWAQVVEQAVEQGDFQPLGQAQNRPGKPDAQGRVMVEVTVEAPTEAEEDDRQRAINTMQALIDLSADQRQAETVEPLLRALAENPAHMKLLTNTYHSH